MAMLLQPQQLAMDESGAEMSEEGSYSGMYSGEYVYCKPGQFKNAFSSFHYCT